MIVVITKLDLKPDTRGRFIEAALVCREGTHKEVGCIQYEFLPSPADQNVAYCVEQWESLDHAIAHFSTNHYKELGKVSREALECYDIKLFDAVPSNALEKYFPKKH